MSSMSRRIVQYFYQPTLCNFDYPPDHPLDTRRLQLTHNLVVRYQLNRKMTLIRAPLASLDDLRRFHADEYIKFIAAPGSFPSGEMSRFKVGCPQRPVLDGLLPFCLASAGSSIAAASNLCQGNCDIAINWGGGNSQPKKAQASGFAFINDVVLAIFQLLETFKTVLYINIGIDRPTSVEEAFYFTDRVLTVSFHHGVEVGTGDGKKYSLNVPFMAGISDHGYRSVFMPIINELMKVYQPKAVVLQSGADSLAGDRLGCFNLSGKGHADCLKSLLTRDIRLLILGGGGYTTPNVARVWCYETALAVGVNPEKLPDYGSLYSLNVPPSAMENKNPPLQTLLHKLLVKASSFVAPAASDNPHLEAALDNLHLEVAPDNSQLELNMHKAEEEELWDGQPPAPDNSQLELNSHKAEEEELWDGHPPAPDNVHLEAAADNSQLGLNLYKAEEEELWDGQPLPEAVKYQFTLHDEILEVLLAVDPEEMTIDSIVYAIKINRYGEKVPKNFEANLKSKAKSLVSHGILEKKGDSFYIPGPPPNSDVIASSSKGKKLAKENPKDLAKEARKKDARDKKQQKHASKVDLVKAAYGVEEGIPDEDVVDLIYGSLSKRQFSLMGRK